MFNVFSKYNNKIIILLEIEKVNQKNIIKNEKNPFHHQNRHNTQDGVEAEVKARSVKKKNKKQLNKKVQVKVGMQVKKKKKSPEEQSLKVKKNIIITIKKRNPQIKKKEAIQKRSKQNSFNII